MNDYKDIPGRKSQLNEFLTRAKKGDQNAVTDLYHLTSSKVNGFIRHIMGSDNDADDIANVVYYEIFKKLHEFEDANAFEGTLMSCAKLRCLDSIRRKESERKHYGGSLDVNENLSSDEMDYEDGLSDPDEPSYTHDLDSMSVYWTYDRKHHILKETGGEPQDVYDAVRGIFDALSATQRAVMMSLYLDRKSIQDTAQILNITEGNVRSVKSQAFRRINVLTDDARRRGVKLYSLSPALLFLLYMNMTEYCGYKASDSVLRTALSAAEASKLGVSSGPGTGQSTAGTGGAGQNAQGQSATGHSTQGQGTSDPSSARKISPSGGKAAMSLHSAKHAAGIAGFFVTHPVAAFVGAVLIGLAAFGGVQAMRTHKPAESEPVVLAETTEVASAESTETSAEETSAPVVWNNDERYARILSDYQDVINDKVSIDNTVLYRSSPEFIEYQELKFGRGSELSENGIENDGRWWESWLQYVTAYDHEGEIVKYSDAPLAVPLESYLFAYYDLDQDGKDELIMAQGYFSDKQKLEDVYMICDIWAEEDEEYRLLAATEDQYTHIDITEKGDVYEYLASKMDDSKGYDYHGSKDSVWCDGVSVFRYTASGPMVVDYSLLNYSISDDSGREYAPFAYYYIKDYYSLAYAHYYKGNQAVELSKDEYEEYTDDLKPMDYKKLDWYKLSEFKGESVSNVSTVDNTDKSGQNHEGTNETSNQTNYTAHESIFTDLPVFKVYNQEGGYDRTIVFSGDGTMREKYSIDTDSFRERHFSIKEKVNDRFYILTDDDHKGSITGRELGSDPFIDDVETLLLYMPGAKIPDLQESSQSQEYIQKGLGLLEYGLFSDNVLNQSMDDPLQQYVIWWDGNVFVGNQE